MKHPNKAVVMGTNYYIGLAIVRNLGRNGVHVVSVNHSGKNMYGKSKYVKENLIGPDFKVDPKGYLNFLIDYAKKQDHKPVLYPTADPYAEFMDNYFYELKEYYLFPMHKKGLLTDLMDKYKLMDFTEKYGVKTPELIYSKEENLIERVIDEIGFPCILKPLDSSSFVDQYREKAFTILNEDMLREKVEICHKDNMEVFVQRIIPGPETNCYCYDAYMNQDGKIVQYTTAHKIRQWPNFFGASTYTTQKWLPRVHEMSKPFLEAIGFRGFVEIELKEDEDTGVIYLIEVNVRFINFTELLCQVGLETPYLTYREMCGETIEEKAIDYDTNIRWRYLYEDIAAIKNYKRTGKLSAEEIRAQNNDPTVVRTVGSTWAVDDPIPGIVFAFNAIVKRIKRYLRIK